MRFLTMLGVAAVCLLSVAVTALLLTLALSAPLHCRAITIGQTLNLGGGC